jgi:CYRIA/CYRIB Rac1 binding domain
MGKLLSLLARDNSSDCCGPKSSYDIFLDFENAQPSPSEQEVYDAVNQVLVRGDTILEEIQVYKVSDSSPRRMCDELWMESKSIIPDKEPNETDARNHKKSKTG